MSTNKSRRHITCPPDGTVTCAVYLRSVFLFVLLCDRRFHALSVLVHNGDSLVAVVESAYIAVSSMLSDCSILGVRQWEKEWRGIAAGRLTAQRSRPDGDVSVEEERVAFSSPG